MEKDHQLFYDELIGKTPFCVAAAQEICAASYPFIPASMNVGIVNIMDGDQFVKVIGNLKRLIRQGCLMKVFSVGGVKIYQGLVEQLSDSSVKAFPADMIIFQSRTGRSLEEFAEIVAHLRAPDGCPWDKEQTHGSLRTHLLEESYEVLQAIDSGDIAGMQEELGDLLLQIILHAQIAYEKNEFDLGDIVKGIHDKIVSRHPHVFGDLNIGDVDAVLKNWEKLKDKERKQGQKETIKGVLDGVPVTLPALARAQKIQDRAARVNFDWKEIDPVIDKVEEELNEVKCAENQPDRAKELGDLLFATVNLIRWYKEDAESLLREANLKFVNRFHFIELQAKKMNRAITDLSFNEMDDLWIEAKKSGI